MRKYLMTGVAALAICAAFTSCSKSEELYDQSVVDGQKVASFEEQYATAFTKFIGGPVGANVDWGFGSKANTRVAAVNSNQWFDGVTEQFKHLVQPADVTAREEEVVSNWFKTHKNPTCDEILLTEFFVQQVYFGTQEYTAKDNNNAEHKVIGGQHMDYLYAGTVDNKDHINNFNTSAPQRTATGLGNMQLMQNSSTANFGYHESYNSQNDRYYLVKNRNWVIKAISVDGVIGYYVGFDYESHGNQGDFEPDGYFDDRIVKIVPGTGYTQELPSYRVIAEDLSAQGDTDFDFNDVVFDVEPNAAGNAAKITVHAAGGIYRLEVDGVEVHRALLGGDGRIDENGLYPMINTGDGPQVDPVVIRENYVGNFSSDANIRTTIQNITVKVWKPTSKESTTAVECTLTADRGKPASKVLVDKSFGIVPEHHSIANEYGLFTSYARGAWKDANEKFWWVQE